MHQISKRLSVEKRDRLINISLGEFAEYGFERASLNRIIKNSGFSKGSFYYHFENKKKFHEMLIIYSAELLSDYVFNNVD